MTYYVPTIQIPFLTGTTPILCPQCGKPAKILETNSSIRDSETGVETRETVFKCPDRCKLKVLYPGDTDGIHDDQNVEFYIKNGTPVFLRPPVDRFS